MITLSALSIRLRSSYFVVQKPRMDPLFPSRCTCGKVIGGKYNLYLLHIQAGLSIDEALNKISILKWCCRTRFRCHVPNLGEGYPDDPTIIRSPEDAEKILPPINTSRIGKISYEDEL